MLHNSKHATWQHSSDMLMHWIYAWSAPCVTCFCEQPVDLLHKALALPIQRHDSRGVLVQLRPAQLRVP